jgi:hypothetical protein
MYLPGLPIIVAMFVYLLVRAPDSPHADARVLCPAFEIDINILICLEKVQYVSQIGQIKMGECKFFAICTQEICCIIDITVQLL